ncbi:ComF family protein [Methylogaea oryzae]|uniref:ComF family protein n=1 Tax=Methylogaea oryzae TaxID=1295382 RepID=UPI0006CF4C8A|nr:phosphoribosyltransferase family protein [Methylogaea oryzae]
MPLHPKRYTERGFNQSLELARLLSQRLGIPLDARHCRRIRTTPPQSRLTALQRRRNLRGAFHIKGAIQADHIAILDDIVTTGATVGALARALRQAGVKRIDIWCCARA